MVQIQGLIAIKAGPTSGNFTLRLNSQSPSGKRAENIITYPLELKGGDHGQNVILTMTIGIQEEVVVRGCT
jgi:hypothetical protein